MFGFGKYDNLKNEILEMKRSLEDLESKLHRYRTDTYTDFTDIVVGLEHRINAVETPFKRGSMTLTKEKPATARKARKTK
jgi:hypothetical protein